MSLKVFLIPDRGLMGFWKYRVSIGSFKKSYAIIRVGTNRSLHIIFSVDNKMPGYTQEKLEPEPTKEVKDVSIRFSMPNIPKFSIVQMVLVASIVLYAFSARKMKGSVVSTLALTIGLLHIYDHLYRVKRGDENLFFLPKKEAYGCKSCQM